jgi:hypothetical protein
MTAIRRSPGIDRAWIGYPITVMASRESKRLRAAHLAPDWRPPRSGLVAGCEAADAISDV